LTDEVSQGCLQFVNGLRRWTGLRSGVKNSCGTKSKGARRCMKSRSSRDSCSYRYRGISCANLGSRSALPPTRRPWRPSTRHARLARALRDLTPRDCCAARWIQQPRSLHLASMCGRTHPEVGGREPYLACATLSALSARPAAAAAKRLLRSGPPLAYRVIALHHFSSGGASSGCCK
jgi:hypothetical protein